MGEEIPTQRERPLIRRAKGFRDIYVTGASANSTPFDFRLMFFSHEPAIPEEPEQLLGVPIHQVIQVEVVMSHVVARQLRDLLNTQLKEKEAQPER